MSNYQIVVLSGPSGAGKSSMAEMLLKKNDISRCVTCTTRKPRAGEREGVDYYFLNEAAFEKQIQAGDFIEHSFHYGNWYGIRLSDIQKSTKSSHVLITLNWRGAKTLEEKLDNVHTIYIEPPSMQVLEKRLGDRGSHARFAYAEEDLKQAKLFKNRVVNDDLKIAYQKLEEMVHQFIQG